MRIFTWHVHGTYLYYLSQAPHDFFIPVDSERSPGYYGKTAAFPWPSNVHEIPVEEVKNWEFDCVVFQSRKNWEEDQYKILSPFQRSLPRIFIEHDPPRQVPTDTHHWIDDPSVLLIHVTHFNDLMWNSGQTPTRVIEHGIKTPPGTHYEGNLERGIVVINNIHKRGRRLGYDIFEKARKIIPLDIVGAGHEAVDGLGEVSHLDLFELISHYRFFFNPIRYTSLGLGVLEAMSVGLPVIGLATTEMATTIQNGINGYVDTNIETLYAHMRRLLKSPNEARRLGEGARQTVRERFSIERFVRDWDNTFRAVIARDKATAVPHASESTMAARWRFYLQQQSLPLPPRHER